MDRIEILKQMQTGCTSSGRGFKKTERLEVIDSLVRKTPYHKIYDGDLSKIYGKYPLRELAQKSRDIYLISTHVDTVPKKLSCKVDEKKHLLCGTFDNTITNAAAAVLMQEKNLPDNVILAFNGDEETGHCGGAREAVKTLISNGYSIENIHVAALDVTYEGFHRDKLYTIENIFDRTYGGRIIDMVHAMDNAGNPEGGPMRHWFCYAPPDGWYPQNLDRNERSAERSMLDEGMIYGKLGAKALSFCIPCGNGNMHGENGVSVEIPVYHGYIDSLEAFMLAYAYEHNHNAEFLQEVRRLAAVRSGYAQELEALTAARREEEAKEWEQRRQEFLKYAEDDFDGNQMNIWQIGMDVDYGEDYGEDYAAEYLACLIDDPDFLEELTDAAVTYDDFDLFVKHIELPPEVINDFSAEELMELLYDFYERTRDLYVDRKEEDEPALYDNDTLDYTGL